MKWIIGLLIVGSSFVLQAQDINLSKKWLIGGNAQLYMEKVGDETGRLIFVFEPQGGYFFTNYLAAGLRLPLSFKSNEYQLLATPFVRYYLPLKGTIRPFAEVNGSVGTKVNLDASSFDVEFREEIWAFGARLGAAFFLNDHISIDLFLYHDVKRTHWKFLTNGVTGSTSYQFFGLGAGFQVYL